MAARIPMHRPPQLSLGVSARPTAAQRGYGSSWQKLRAFVLSNEPLCRECMGRGEIVPATDVDHIVPRSRGGSDDEANLQSLCHACHSRKTATRDGAFGRARKSDG